MRTSIIVPEHEATVDLAPEDVVEALFDLNSEKITWVLNRIASVLRQFSDDHINTMLSPAQREIVHSFLIEQAKRYAVNGGAD